MHTTNPARIVVSRLGLSSPVPSARVARRPPTTNRSAVAATANENASNAKAGPVWISATTTPAIAGPISPESCWLPCSRALAGGRVSSSTSIGRIALMAG